MTDLVLRETALRELLDAHAMLEACLTAYELTGATEAHALLVTMAKRQRGALRSYARAMGAAMPPMQLDDTMS